ncbi:MAG: hypothetical protein WAZ19_01180 [Anaerolineae bacterium]
MSDTSPSSKPGDQRLQEVYDRLNNTVLEPDVKIAIKAMLTIRQAVNWHLVREKLQVDGTIIKYIRASNAQNLPTLVNEVLEKLPFDLIFRPALGDFALDLYRHKRDDETSLSAWDKAFQRIKKETIPIFLISKKFYQDSEE